MLADTEVRKTVVRSRKREVLRRPGIFPIEIEIAGGFEKAWLENGLVTGTASVVERSLEKIASTGDEGQPPILWIVVPTSEVPEINVGEEPWVIREMSNEDRESVRLCSELVAERSRSDWQKSGESKGVFNNSHEEKVMVVNLVDKCPHAIAKMKENACGHP